MEEKIINEYLSGKSILCLSKEYQMSYSKIQKLLIKEEVVIRGGRHKIKLNDEQLSILYDEFVKGTPKKEIATMLSVDVSIINRSIQKGKFERELKRINKNIKSDYFSKIDSPEKAYWLGLLFTDGSVDHYQKTGRIRLCLQIKDLEILEQFKADLCIDSKIIYDKREGKHSYSVEFADEQIFNDLKTYSIIPNKTYEVTHIPFEKIPKEFLLSFLLGLYDGDGCLTYSNDYSKDVTLSLTANYKSICRDFQIQIDKIINKQNPNKIIFTSAWHVNWRGRLQVLKILDALYENSPRRLNRKYQKYLLLKNSLN